MPYNLIPSGTPHTIFAISHLWWGLDSDDIAGNIPLACNSVKKGVIYRDLVFNGMWDAMHHHISIWHGNILLSTAS